MPDSAQQTLPAIIATTVEPVNPLAEASPASLDELFSRNPLDLTDGDIERIVVELQRRRVEWVEAEAKGAKRAPKAKSAAVAKAIVGKVDLSDLDL